MSILGVGMHRAQQKISDCSRMLYLGLPQEVAFELGDAQPWEHIFYILWRLISTFQQPAWENKTCYREQPSQEWDTSTILACKTDKSETHHSHACPNLFVPRAETAAPLINSCEQGNANTEQARFLCKAKEIFTL